MDKFQVPARKNFGERCRKNLILGIVLWSECLRGCQVVHQCKASEDRKDRQNLRAAEFGGKNFRWIFWSKGKNPGDILKNSSLPNHKPVLSTISIHFQYVKCQKKTHFAKVLIDLRIHEPQILLSTFVDFSVTSQGLDKLNTFVEENKQLA